METAGVGPALVIEKTAVGLVCWLVAVHGAAAIHDAEPWIWKIPMLPPVRRWLQSGDRAWIALIPLYGTALAQALAAAAWLTLARR